MLESASDVVFRTVPPCSTPLPPKSRSPTRVPISVGRCLVWWPHHPVIGVTTGTWVGGVSIILLMVVMLPVGVRSQGLVWLVAMILVGIRNHELVWPIRTVATRNHEPPMVATMISKPVWPFPANRSTVRGTKRRDLVWRILTAAMMLVDTKSQELAYSTVSHHRYQTVLPLVWCHRPSPITSTPLRSP